MEENKTLNDMNSEQSINTETPVLENPIADMAPVTEMPAAEVVTEVAPVAEMPAAEVVTETAPVAEMPAAEVVTEVAPVAEMPAAEVVTEAAPVVEMPAAEVVTEAAPVTEMPAAEVVTEVAPVAEMPAAEVVTEVAPVAETPAPVVTETAPATETPVPETTPAEGTAAPVTEEKKKAPVNIVAVLIIVVCCVLGGYILWSRSKPEPTPTPNPAPVTTPSDETETPSVNVDPLNHPVAAADKYTYSADGVEYTVYLKSGSNNFYYLTSAGCVSGNYGTYTEIEGTLTLQSDTYYNCESCYYTSADATNGSMATLAMTLTKDTTANTLSNADGTQLFTFAGTEEIGNPFNLEGVHACDNLENAN